MIIRIWHGWTVPENASAYEAVLRSEVFPSIQRRDIPGYRGIELCRRDLAEAVEFMTLMRFDSMESVRVFAGDDPELAVVPPAPRALLMHFDARSQHCVVMDDAVRQS